MRIEIPTEGIEQYLAAYGFDLTKEMLMGKAVGAAMVAIEAEMRLHAEREEARQEHRIVGAPASANNLQRPSEQPPEEPGLNITAPMRNLQTMLCQEWFDKVCVDRKKYTKQWRELVIAKLMGSRHKKEIAKKWEERSQRLQIKGHVIGAFVKAGVLKGSKLAVARTFYNIEDDTPEAKTLAKYMGDLNRVYYADWIIEYIKKDSLIEKE
ncbi:MAG: hypothetical protein IJJ68_07665 [Prevotella sp.]|nr:hypothetical protein [Prevotella sp.]